MQAATSHHLDDLDALTYLPLVGHVVQQLATRYPRSVDRAAMWNAGAAGLLHAVEHAQTTGMLFSQHAIRVIRASVLETIDVTAPTAMPVTDEQLAEGFGIAADQLATLRDAQMHRGLGALPSTRPAPASTAPRPVPAPLVSSQAAPRWTPAAAAAYR